MPQERNCESAVDSSAQGIMGCSSLQIMPVRVLVKPACSHGNAFGWVNGTILLLCSGFCLVKILNKALSYKWQKLQSNQNVIFDWGTSGNTGSCTSERRSLTGM